MTHLTRPRTLLLILALAAGILTGSGTPASADVPQIDPTQQHVFVATVVTGAGMKRDPTFYGRWATDGRALPGLDLEGANEATNSTRFRADSPVPGLARSGAHGFCVTQRYAATTTAGPSGRASYRTGVVVRRHGREVARRFVAGSYRVTARPTSRQGATLRTIRDRVRLPGFTFRRGDHVTWKVSGSLHQQIKKFGSDLSIGPRCR